MEDKKEGNVQSLGEKTLKFDCENGMEYRGFWVKIVFKVYGDKIGNESMSGVDGGEFVQGFGGEYISKHIENIRFDIIINMFPYTTKSMKCCVGDIFCLLNFMEKTIN